MKLLEIYYQSKTNRRNYVLCIKSRGQLKLKRKDKRTLIILYTKQKK